MTIRIDGTNSAANPGITGSDTDTGLQFGTDEVNIVTGGSTRATVNSSGHLIVGGTTAGNAGTRTVSIGNPGVTTGGLQLWSTTTGASFVQFGDATASASDHYRGLIGYEHNNDALIFYTAAAERARILSGGGLTFNGDTAAANALDDYEEGTFTPDVFNDGSTSRWSDKTGRYRKIGSKVTIWIDCDGGTQPRSGTSTGTLKITGLPFTINSTLTSNFILGIAGYNRNSGGSADGNVNAAGSDLFVRIGGTNQADLIDYFSACFTYFV